MNAKKIIQIAGLFLFIVGLPLGSYYYLKSGFDYHKEALDRLKDLGELPGDYQLVDLQQETLRPLELEGRIVLATVLDPGQEEYLKTCVRLADQFEASESAWFLFFLSGEVDSTFNWPSFVEEKGFPENEYTRFFDLRNERNNKCWRENLMMSDHCGSPCTTFAFIDTKRQIRQYYDVKDEEQLKELVRISAIMLPKKKVEDPQLKREREK